MRKLASIQTITDVIHHPNADLLDLVWVLGWQCVVKRDEFKVGDKVLYLEIDSFLPEWPEFEFLRASSYRTVPGLGSGFRLRTIKLRKELSQGLVLPISILDRFEGFYTYNGEVKDSYVWMKRDAEGATVMVKDEVGSDCTELLDVVKWELPVPAQLQGRAKGNFPSWISKTDQERIQNSWKEIDELWRNAEFEVTEKLDGSSTTIYFKDGVVGVCSRNFDLTLSEENANNSFVAAAHKHKYIDALSAYGKNVAIQGELVGPGIQGNKYKLETPLLFVFDVWSIDECRYLPRHERLAVLDELQKFGAYILEVPWVSHFKKIPETLADLLTYAEGKSALNPATEREGIVWKSLSPDSYGNIRSFKAISNKFLLKHDD